MSARVNEYPNFNFLRTNATYKQAMVLAHKRFKWVERTLK